MNEEILKKIYGLYGKELFLYLFSFCRDKELAEDLVQDTFLKALLSLPDTHTNIRAWLYKVARNQYYNWTKKNRREVLDEKILDSISTNDIDNFFKKYIQQDNARVLYIAMQQLHPQKRELLELQYFGQVSLKEIANIIGVSKENVRVLSHRAKKELKQILEVYGYEI